MSARLDPRNCIVVRGAHEHNLQQVDLELPRDALLVFTGVSGSGKSSLVFDTLFREAERRYLETFASYARQLLGKVDRPAVEQLRGLSPALAVAQRSSARSPRSTVGTLTELHSFLRLLLAKLGTAHCAGCGSRLTAQSAERIAEGLLERHPGERITLLAPVVDGHKGARRQELTRLAAEGFSELRIDGRLCAATPVPEVDPHVPHQIEAVVAHLRVTAAEPAALLGAVDRALALGGGVVKLLAGEALERYSTERACPACAAPSQELGPRLLSFNSPYGACPACHGLGVEDAVDPALLVADPSKSLRQGALALTTPSGYIVYSQVTMDVLNQVCQAHGFSVDVPWRELRPEEQRVVLYGSDRIRIPFGKHPLESRLRWKGITARPREEGTYQGIIPTIEQILAHKRNDNALRFVRSRPCDACLGRRLRPEALAVTFREQNIADLCARPLGELAAFLGEARLTAAEAPIGAPIIDEMRRRLGLLTRLGLGYLELARESTTLSGGEERRIRLATQVGTRLRGILYVLDEPTIGLHARDNARLLATLCELRDLGNTVAVVEHDEQTIRSADWLVDIGPGAGPNGGRVLFSGPPDELLRSSPAPSLPPAQLEPWRASVTRRYLAGEQRLVAPTRRREGRGELWVRGAAEHNLRGIDVPFKLGALNVVTGVSGAGKSTLVGDVLARALRQRLHGATEPVGRHRTLEHAEAIDKLIEIDQSPIGRTPRSNPATYTKLHDGVRQLFAALPEARARGWNAGRFSFNVAGGRCEACEGAGRQSIGMHYMADVEIVCEACGGRRFDDATLEVRLRGKSIADVLDLTVEQALAFFHGERRICRVLQAMSDVGLGYLTLGQSATTLSGGEAQRVKLSAELGRVGTGNTLYILDEPTTGLHLADVELLLTAVERLVEHGNTVIVVEHHLAVVRAADWVVDLGPDGGQDGGALCAVGTPESVAREAGSPTGAALREAASNAAVAPGAIGHGARVAPDSPIRLRGVTTHNLQHIDVDIPTGQLTVVTGVSGSGKSSLAFDTLFGEAERRFAESLSTHARRFVSRSRRAEVEQVSGLSPAVAVRAQAAARNPRSTVGTLSEIYDDLRLLYARGGVSCCPRCNLPLADGPSCGCGFVARRPLTARMFSFNHSEGACPACKGLGLTHSCDPDLLVTDPSRPLDGGAMAGHKTGAFYGDPGGQHVAILRAVGQALGIDFSRPWAELGPEARRIAMYGAGEQRFRAVWHFARKGRAGEHVWETPWQGLARYVDEEHARKHADARGEAMACLMKHSPCPECHGERLRPEPRAVRCGGLTIGELGRLSVGAAHASLSSLPERLDRRRLPVVEAVRAQILGRLRSLCDAGLDHLSLDRAAATLSGGEAQRLRLATQLDSGLRGVTYVLDEPTVGLHAHDVRPLLGLLERLCSEGNTVVVVEHDAAVMRAAHHLIELGPGAGPAGGRLVACGSVAEILAHPRAKTGRYLRAPHEVVPLAQRRRPLRPGIRIGRAGAHNLQGIDCHVPLGGIVAVTGVSGSGKSSLVLDVLVASARRGGPVGCESISGLGELAAVVCVAEQAAAVGPGSTPATYLGIFDAVRELFARSERARERRWSKSRFSLNVKGGRCEACQGTGQLQVGMDFLPELHVACEQCRGRRYQADTLECFFRGCSIADVLGLTASEARALFAAEPRIAERLQALEEVGLGYLRLGQPTPTLSGGELQRLALAAALARDRGRSGTLLVLDEPTTGLHPEDVAQLVAVLHRLADAGSSLLLIEHQLDVVKNADWVIDLGPGGGEHGGRLVAEGTPEQLAATAASLTGRELAEHLGPLHSVETA